MVYTFANRKGGCGKTSTVVNLGMSLSMNGHKTLLIDMDSQANLSAIFFHKAPEYTVTDLLMGKQGAVKPVRENLYVLPADGHLAVMSDVLKSKSTGELELRDKIEPYKEVFDYILIDTQPSTDHVTKNAITAADKFIVPAFAGFFEFYNYEQLSKIVELYNKRFNLNIENLGVLISRHFEGTVTSKKYAGEIRDGVYPGFKTMIRKDEAIHKASDKRMPVVEFDPNSRAVEDYQELYKEFVNA